MISKKIQFLFPIAVTIHNLEEAFLYPLWSRNTQSWDSPVEDNKFLFAVFVLTILAYLVTYLNYRCKKESVFVYTFNGYCMAMLLNAIFPHTIYSIISRSYMPGLLSGLLLNLPISGYLIYSAFNAGLISSKKFYIYSILVSVGLIILIPILFSIGSMFNFK